MVEFLIKIDRKYSRMEAKQILKSIMKYFKAKDYTEYALGLLLEGRGFLKSDDYDIIFGWTCALWCSTPRTTHNMSQFIGKQQLKYNKDLK